MFIVVRYATTAFQQLYVAIEVRLYHNLIRDSLRFGSLDPTLLTHFWLSIVVTHYVYSL